METTHPAQIPLEDAEQAARLARIKQHRQQKRRLAAAVAASRWETRAKVALVLLVPLWCLAAAAVVFLLNW